MQKLIPLSWVVLCALVLGACAQGASQASNIPINPGDTIGSFLITTGKEGEFFNIWDLDCLEVGSSVTCTARVGARVNISAGIYDSQHSGVLDELWESQKYDLFVEDRPVNLQAFGAIDLNHPLVGPMRVWNVVVEATEPGELSVQDSGELRDNPFGKRTKIIFE